MRLRTRRRLRNLAIAATIGAIGAGLWISRERAETATVSDVITRPAPELTPTAQLLLPDLRGATVVVPDRPHAPEEVSAPDRSSRIKRTRSFSVSTNHLGLRGREIASPTPGFRVLAVGDSVTFGWGVADGESWPARLGERLGIEVLNAGVPAQRPDAITAWTLQNAPALDVDLVLYCRRPDGREPDPAAHLAAALRRLQEGLGSTPVALILPPLSTFDPRGLASDPSERAALRAALPTLPMFDLTPIFRAALPKPGVILQIEADHQRVLREPGDQVLLELDAPPSGLAEQITALFEADPTIKEPLFFDGGHPDAEGFSLFADALAGWLRQRGLVPGGLSSPPSTTGAAPMIPAHQAEWLVDPPAFVDDPAFYGEVSWDDVRGRVLQHQVIILRDAARLAASGGDLKRAAERYREAVRWVEAHPIQSGVGQALYIILLDGLRRDLALTEALATGAPPPVPSSGIARLRALMLAGEDEARLTAESKTLLFEPLDPGAFGDFQDRHALRIALVKAATDALDPLAFVSTWGPWEPDSRTQTVTAILAAAAGPSSLPRHQRAAALQPRAPARFTAEGLGALPTGDTWVDTGGEPGPRAIGRLEVLSLDDPEHKARLEAAAARLQEALTRDPRTVPDALAPLLDFLRATPYTSRYYNIKAARDEAIRQLARQGAPDVAVQILDQSFPLHAQDFACPNRAGILMGLRGRLLAIAGDPGAEDALSAALREGAAFWDQIDRADAARP